MCVCRTRCENEEKNVYKKVFLLLFFKYFLLVQKIIFLFKKMFEELFF